MPLYWAADTDGARYCVRAAGMTEAVEAFRAHVGEDPEGIDLAADDDVELIGFDSLGNAGARPRQSGEHAASDARERMLADIEDLRRTLKLLEAACEHRRSTGADGK